MAYHRQGTVLLLVVIATAYLTVAGTVRAQNVRGDCHAFTSSSCPTSDGCMISSYCTAQNASICASASTNSECYDISQTSSYSCDWDHDSSTCNLASHPCFVNSDQASCSSETDCLWADICVSEQVVIGDSICEHEVCASELAACTGGCNETFVCVISSIQSGTCEPDDCVDQCLQSVNRTQEEDAAFQTGLECEMECYNSLNNDDKDTCDQRSSSNCTVDGECSIGNYCAPWNERDLCEAETAAECQGMANAANNYSCAWNVNEQYCYVKDHYCHDGHESYDSCTAINGCNWNEYCYNATDRYHNDTNDDGGDDDYCEREVCADYIAACTGGCNATFSCALELGRAGECDNGECVSYCESIYNRTESEQAAFDELRECEFSCHGFNGNGTDNNECESVCSGYDEACVGGCRSTVDCISDNEDAGNCDGLGCVDMCVRQHNRSLSEQYAFFELAQCYLGCDPPEGGDHFDLCEVNAPWQCEYFDGCRRDEYCAVADDSICSQFNSASDCSAGSTNDYECEWHSNDNNDGSASGTSGYCHVREHQCYQIDDADGCESNDLCEWRMQCFNSSRHDGDDDYCEREVCVYQIEECSGACSDIFECIVDAFNADGCEGLSCIGGCKDAFVANETELESLEELLQCEFDCHNLTLPDYPDFFCSQYAAVSTCDFYDGCELFYSCQPGNPQLCAATTERECFAPVGSAFSCEWDGSHCYVESHPCFEAQNDQECASSSFRCIWEPECHNATVVEAEQSMEHSIEIGNGTMLDDVADCELGCLEKLRPCLDDEECLEIYLCVRNFGMSYGTVFALDQTHFDECTAIANDASSVLLFYTAGSCVYKCFEDDFCEQEDGAICFDESFQPEFDAPVSCDSEVRCHPTFAHKEECRSILRRDTCDDTSGCSWDGDKRSCNLDDREHYCYNFFERDQCKFNGCEADDECVTAPTEQVCNRRCFSQVNECNDNFLCEAAYECLYDSHAQNDGVCNEDCHERCERLLQDNAVASALYFSATTCSLSCFGVCNPNSQPRITTPSICTSESVIEISVKADVEFGIAVQHACVFSAMECASDADCVTVGFINRVSSSGDFMVQCPIPEALLDASANQAVSAEVTVAIVPYSFYPGPYCKSINTVSVLLTDSCDNTLACREETVPRVFGVAPICDLEGQSTVNVSVYSNAAYADNARATCAFWIPDNAGNYFCNWHGCYSPAVVAQGGSLVICNLPAVVPGNVDIRVTVQVWDDSESDSRTSNTCFSHQGRHWATWKEYDYGTFTRDCPVPECTREYVPRIISLSPECDLDDAATDITLDVSVDPSYGEAARARCGFWLFDSTLGRWSCNLLSCYSPATVAADGSTVTCDLPGNLDSESDEEVRVTIQVWHADNPNKQRNLCFSHEGQSSFSWSAGDYGSFSPVCPAPACTNDFIPRISSVLQDCVAPEEGAHVTLALEIDPSYENPLARCSFCSPEGNGCDCSEYGCYASSAVPVVFVDDQAYVNCTLPDDVSGDVDSLRVTVQVWETGNEDGKSARQCFSDSRKLPSRWVSNDFGEFSVDCGVTECTAENNPRVRSAQPFCGFSEAATSIAVQAVLDESYLDGNGVAMCTFWIEDESAASGYSCNFHGCYESATISDDGFRVFCDLPDNLPRNTNRVRITIQAYHVDNSATSNVFCFSHRGRSPTLWEDGDYTEFQVLCDDVLCRQRTKPRLYSIEPECGVEAGSTVDITARVDSEYGSNARATCAFWVDGSCNWHGCYAPATVSDDVITCEVPDTFPSGADVRVTTQVYHVDNESGRQSTNCFSHGGRPQASWGEFDSVLIQGDCVCPAGVKVRDDCPDICFTALCPRFPNAVCVQSNCGSCRVDFYEEELDSYDGVEPVNCALQDRCSRECKAQFDACIGNLLCRRAVSEYLSVRDDCDEDCLQAIYDNLPNVQARRRLNNLYTCYNECESRNEYQPVCSQPRVIGPCDAAIPRWWFNQASQQCEEFTYGGCSGNENNFGTREECENSCIVGACCTQKVLADPYGNYGYGYDEEGYDKYGYNMEGYARDGYSRRPSSYESYETNPYMMSRYGQDQRGYNTQGRDGSGYTDKGVSQTNSRDGLQFDYPVSGQYNRNGYDRSGLDAYGMDAYGYGYDGINRNAQYECRQTTRRQCQQFEEDDETVTVTGFSQGRTCDEAQCGNPNWNLPRQCVYATKVFDFGESFEYGCRSCVCGTDGVVQCSCSSGTTVRKEIRDMTVEEIETFTTAVNLMKENGAWEWFRIHLSAIPQAHGNPAFLPWHREFLDQLEATMREVTGNCDVFVPYWDWTIDVLSPFTSPVWNVVGGNGNYSAGNCVTDGPFADFEPCIERAWDASRVVPSFADMAFVLAEESYTQMCAQMEARHGDVHTLVGGFMSGYASPYDPIFFMHHAQIDRLWYLWQTDLGHGTEYPASLLNRPLFPFPKSAIDVLDSERQLCTIYQAPGSSPPCNGTIFGGTPETEGYYPDGNVPEYNRDGYNAAGYDQHGRDRYGNDNMGDPVVVIGGEDEMDFYNMETYGFDDRNFDSYGFSINGTDERGCTAGFDGPLYMRDVYRVQSRVLELVKNGTTVPVRTCRPLQALPSWWIDTNWVRRDGEYNTNLTSYEMGVEAMYNMSVNDNGEYMDPMSYDDVRRNYTRSPHGFVYDLCFNFTELSEQYNNVMYGYNGNSGVEHGGYTCPPGVEQVFCFVDPCEVASCPNDPDAVCVANTCGSCTADFYDADTHERVDCHMDCDGLTSADCDMNPCANAKCNAVPDAKCETSPCSGCQARWFNGTTGEEVSCEVEKDCSVYGTDFVCAESGETYDNLCFAEEAGAMIAYGGRCLSCEELCGRKNFTKPVCGVDGFTYDSECSARCEEVKIAYPGECQARPETCDDVNSFKATEEERRSICHDTTTVCIAGLVDLLDNRCFWNENTRRCSCEPTDLVCTSSYEGCGTCCNIDLRTCIQNGTLTAEQCWSEYSTCGTTCDAQFGVEEFAEDAFIEFMLEISYNGTAVLDADQLLDAIIIGLGLPVPKEDFKLSLGSEENRRRRRAEDDDGSVVSLSVQIAVNETEANSTVSMVEDSLNNGGVQGALAEEAGVDTDEGFNAVGGVSFQKSTSGGTTSGPNSNPSSAFGVGAIAGIAAGAAVIVIIVIVVLVTKTKKGKNVHRRVSRRLSKHGQATISMPHQDSDEVTSIHDANDVDFYPSKRLSVTSF